MNFALILFTATLVTGGVWLVDHLLQRYRPAARRAEGAKLPLLVEYARSFFPVILAVFLLRSFLVEPFKIPSGSMIPTLQIGDFILVNKYEYGIRLPVINQKVLSLGEPQRGDVMVFRFPQDERLDYIKRVVGVPGDTIEYRADKRLIINGRPVAWAPTSEYAYEAGGLNWVRGQQYREALDAGTHTSLVVPSMPPVIEHQVQGDFAFRDNCRYENAGFRCTVPVGHYFMMGDNRDASNDSRYWGFVPDRNIVGRAFFIWWNFDDFATALKNLGAPKRIGRLIADV